MPRVAMPDSQKTLSQPGSAASQSAWLGASSPTAKESVTIRASRCGMAVGISDGSINGRSVDQRNAKIQYLPEGIRPRILSFYIMNKYS